MLSIFLALPLLAFGGTCSDLTVTGGAPNTNLVFALTGGAARSPALVVIGETTGQLNINFGSLGSLQLGLLPPFTVAPMGVTDSAGNATLSVRVPANAPGIDLHGQALTVSFILQPPSLDFCTSDVVGFHVGGA